MKKHLKLFINSSDLLFFFFFFCNLLSPSGRLFNCSACHCGVDECVVTRCWKPLHPNGPSLHEPLPALSIHPSHPCRTVCPTLWCQPYLSPCKSPHLRRPRCLASVAGTSLKLTSYESSDSSPNAPEDNGHEKKKNIKKRRETSRRFFVNRSEDPDVSVSHLFLRRKTLPRCSCWAEKKKN